MGFTPEQIKRAYQERCKTEQCRRKDTHANLYDGAFSGKTGTIRISG